MQKAAATAAPGNSFMQLLLQGLVVSALRQAKLQMTALPPRSALLPLQQLLLRLLLQLLLMLLLQALLLVLQSLSEPLVCCQSLLPPGAGYCCC